MIVDDDVVAAQKAAVVLMDEEHSKAEGRGEMSETELLIMDQFTILVRDLYAFYPLLIRFVDYNRWATSCEVTSLKTFIQSSVTVH